MGEASPPEGIDLRGRPRRHEPPATRLGRSAPSAVSTLAQVTGESPAGVAVDQHGPLRWRAVDSALFTVLAWVGAACVAVVVAIGVVSGVWTLGSVATLVSGALTTTSFVYLTRQQVVAQVSGQIVLPGQWFGGREVRADEVADVRYVLGEGARLDLVEGGEVKLPLVDSRLQTQRLRDWWSSHGGE